MYYLYRIEDDALFDFIAKKYSGLAHERPYLYTEKPILYKSKKFEVEQLYCWDCQNATVYDEDDLCTDCGKKVFLSRPIGYMRWRYVLSVCN